MSGREEPYDPYIPSGGAQGESHDGGNQKTAALQAQIQDTIRVMNHNVQAATQRGENVNTLQNKTDDLREASRGFHSSAKRARRQMFKKNVWMTIIVIIGVLIVIGIIVGIVKGVNPGK